MFNGVFPPIPPPLLSQAQSPETKGSRWDGFSLQNPPLGISGLSTRNFTQQKNMYVPLQGAFLKKSCRLTSFLTFCPKRRAEIYCWSHPMWYRGGVQLFDEGMIFRWNFLNPSWGSIISRLNCEAVAWICLFCFVLIWFDLIWFDLIWLFVCLFVCLFACLFVCLFVCLMILLPFHWLT